MGLNVTLLRNSFELVVERAPNLTHHFYDELFTRFPQARPMFHRQARSAQEKMLTEALVAVLDHLEDAPWLEEKLGAMGAKHIDYGVTPEMYGWVGEALLATLAKVAGEDWNDEIAGAWGEAYGAISSLMLAGAQPAIAAE